ncbi:hypothetical protein IMSHALPRED_007663 [Imshaugia aleurites]|uniref:C2H2-type domain-containing protein n=1 Tax=Imshaugia aleurites TaxID=172621 RepID=A0A8H3FR79_9LECA|nr:hypothetical protein IMSHALPRED_007663 [Imshaugia aleurites]
MTDADHASERLSTAITGWQNQHFVSQQGSYCATDSLQCNVDGGIPLDPEEDWAQLSLNHRAVTDPVQYQYGGITGSLETPAAGINSTSSRQVPASNVSQTEIGRDVSPQDSDKLKNLVPDQVCTCAACLNGYRCPEHLRGREAHPDCVFGCRVTGCQWTINTLVHQQNSLECLFWHEKRKSHHGKPGDYRCRETGCKFVTKRWSDFKRHTSSKHCIKPQKLDCPVLSCKYHQIGFARKDKLKSHYQTVHEGKLLPGKPNQAIKSKVKDST